jgi:hypothetical protein
LRRARGKPPRPHRKSGGVAAHRTCQYGAAGCAEAKHGSIQHAETALRFFCSTRENVEGPATYRRGVAGIWQVSNTQMTVVRGASTQGAGATRKSLTDQTDGSPGRPKARG